MNSSPVFQGEVVGFGRADYVRVVCAPTGYESPDEDEYLVVSKHMIEDRWRLLRSDREMLREILLDSLKHVNDLRTIARAQRALDITRPR